MNAVQDRRRRWAPRVRMIAFGLVAVIVGGLASLKPVGQPSATLVALSGAQAAEFRVHFQMCGRVRHTCVVDGDTIWLNGLNLRLQGYDTPSPIPTSAAARPKYHSPGAPVRACSSCSTPTPSPS